MKLRDILRGELIGKTCKVGNIEGKIIDESKSMITIMHEKKVKRFIKKTNMFKIKEKNNEFIIKGKQIEMSPEERVEKIKLDENG